MPKKPRSIAASLRTTQRLSAASRGYGGQWRRVRAWHLAEHPLCVHCLEAGLEVAATDVDHIRPMAMGGHATDPDNLQSLCHACHARKTARESGGGG